ncbi:MAG TPA: maleylpyruvate isomerase N-terminal domain-containing protein [Geodermatophilus sp.]|nr:maleylpyruvate isomerase N-terminal domain-containing protein [Geodermatophilus sp.]
MTPTGGGGDVVAPGDVLKAAGALEALGQAPDGSPRWDTPAAPTTWTAARTLGHIADALVFYAGQVACRADRRLPALRDGRDAPPGEQLADVGTAAHVLAGQLRDLGDGRAWHPSGLADATGWAGMAVTELLVHGHDAARALHVPLSLPPDVCARTLARVFPWVGAEDAPPPARLLAVTGRADLPGVPHDPDWWWQSAPLAEWDGRPRRRTAPPAWR